MRKQWAAEPVAGVANRSSKAKTSAAVTGLEHVHPSRVIALAAAANVCAAMVIAIAPAIGFYIV